MRLLVIAFSFDDVGVIINAALILTAMIVAAKLRLWLRGFAVAAVIITAETAYVGIGRLLFDPGNPGLVPGTGLMPNL